MFVQAHQRVFLHINDNTAPIVHSLNATTDHAPTIHSVISVWHDTLQLSYFVESADWLDFPSLSDTIERRDFLWENHCLECFFNLQNGDDNGYFELNFSPAGFFNLYQFSDYRTPNQLPPIWADGSVCLTDTAQTDGLMAYHLTVKLQQNQPLHIKQISPTAIIYQNGEPIFYAIKHANPPDFHHRAFWQDFN